MPGPAPAASLAFDVPGGISATKRELEPRRPRGSVCAVARTWVACPLTVTQFKGRKLRKAKELTGTLALREGARSPVKELR